MSSARLCALAPCLPLSQPHGDTASVPCMCRSWRLAPGSQTPVDNHPRPGGRGYPLPLALNSEILFLMAPNPETDLVEVAVLSGGPMDGHEHSIENGTGELCVVMTDGQQHRYVRTDEFQVLPDGRSALVFEWTGRYFGPK